MEQYIVSARKYRPQTFMSVVGQAALTATLKNAIANNHLAHAYLFCGPRGVGKTTCARIFAKTINCLNPTANGEACNECESCKAFNEQRSFNIHELDAASNNSVDDIRNLVDQVRIPPQIGKYSVYIVDEVHMLSSAAFNAFLKTLEEPPAHAIFILATTEKHKIIPTILSRCQIYDFNRITINDTVAHLQYVAKNEGVEAEDMALNVIAQKADGAMRDALSIFDQVVSFCGNKVTYQGVISNLNVLDYDYYFRLVDALLQNRVPEALMIFDEVLSKGFEGQHFVGGLSSHLRDLMVSLDEMTLPLLEVGELIAERYKEQSKRCELWWLYKALEYANDCDLAYRASRNKRLLVEVMLIRIAGLVVGGVQPKKVEPELPLITVAPTPGGQSNAQCIMHNAQSAVNSQHVLTSSPSGTPLKTEGEYVGQLSIVNVETRDARYETRDVTLDIQGKKPVVVAAPIVVQMPKVVSVSLNATSVSGESQSFTSKENGVVETVDSSVSISQELKKSDFTNDDLIRVWRLYAKKIDGELHTSNTMQNFLPVKGEGALVIVKLINTMQLESLSRHKRTLEQFLAKELNNSDIVVCFEVEEQAAQLMMLTSDEKFKHMQEVNPDFRRLKGELGLEIV
ncbi:MAG: DNA polymerase III subunit gamma/tau [Paludibacteraceae bacterium]|nr:DNA polymerase III subunit gamma/tau [Paludibacteraceae bacterium]